MAPVSNLLFLDLETNGLWLEKDSILEIAWVLTDFDLNPIASYESLVTPSDPNWLVNMNSFVTDMHTQNGLIKEIQDLPKPISLERVLNETLQLLGDANAYTDRMYLAGAGVSHFDYAWVQHYLPRLGDKLMYSQLDISVVRRACQVFGAAEVFPETPKPEASVAHRAMFDVEQALADARTFQEFLHYARVPIQA